MDWKKWLTFSPYKKLWMLIGHRPWTYIYRDMYRKYEYFIQAQWFWTCVLVLWLAGVSIPVKMLGIGWAIYSYGYINGHFFWGTKIIEGQTEGEDAAE